MENQNLVELNNGLSGFWSTTTLWVPLFFGRRMHRKPVFFGKQCGWICLAIARCSQMRQCIVSNYLGTHGYSLSLVLQWWLWTWLNIRVFVPSPNHQLIWSTSPRIRPMLLRSERMRCLASGTFAATVADRSTFGFPSTTVGLLLVSDSESSCKNVAANCTVAVSAHLLASDCLVSLHCGWWARETCCGFWECGRNKVRLKIL